MHMYLVDMRYAHKNLIVLSFEFLKLAVLEKWYILREKICQAANIHHIKEEMGDLKTDFSNVHSLFCTCKQFDITDMDALKEKIRSIQVKLSISHV